MIYFLKIANVFGIITSTHLISLVACFKCNVYIGRHTKCSWVDEKQHQIQRILLFLIFTYQLYSMLRRNISTLIAVPYISRWIFFLFVLKIMIRCWASKWRRAQNVCIVYCLLRRKKTQEWENKAKSIMCFIIRYKYWHGNQHHWHSYYTIDGLKCSKRVKEFLIVILLNTFRCV